MNKQRIDYIDIAKGIAIFLMVLGHSYSEGNGTYILKLIYSFHMPLFFITTGVLYGTRKEINIKLNIKRKVKRLLWPYLFWETAYQLFLSILQIAGGASMKETLCKNVINIIKLGNSRWFLPIMFGAYVIYYVLRKLLKNKNLFIIGSALIMLLSIIFSTSNNEIIGIVVRILVSAGFIAIGYFFEGTYNKDINIVLLAIFTIVHIVVCMMSKEVSIASLTFGNPIIYILMGSFGTYIVYCWSKKIEVTSKMGDMLGLWGRNSLQILCLHSFVIQVVRLLDYKILGDFLILLGDAEGIVFSIVIMVILTIILKKYSRFFDWTFGK